MDFLEIEILGFDYNLAIVLWETSTWERKYIYTVLSPGGSLFAGREGCPDSFGRATTRDRRMHRQDEPNPEGRPPISERRRRAEDSRDHHTQGSLKKIWPSIFCREKMAMLRAIQVLRNAFFLKILHPSSPANNVEPYIFVMLFSGKAYTPTPYCIT